MGGGGQEAPVVGAEGVGTEVEVRRRWGPVLALAVIAVLSLWGAWRYWRFRTYERAMVEIRGDLENNRNATAAKALHALLAWKPDSDEAAYLLGTCELARGRLHEADRAFAGVPPDSRFAARATLGRLQVQMELGRHAAAEQIVRDALNDPRVDRSGLPLLLGPIYSQQGRLEETLRLVRASWEALDRVGKGASEQAINLVRAYVDLRANPVPIEVIRSALDQAGRSAPEDDRVWLGKANLAIREGSYEEASKWLDACQRKRSHDAPVWRARLNFGLATEGVATVREALAHLPADEWTPAEIQKLAAWLATRRGDADSERRALEALLAANPADPDALDRVARLAEQDGQREFAAALRRKRAEFGQLEARYEKLYRRNQPERDAAEMARLAERLGRGFEARAFLTVATAVDPDRDDLRSRLAVFSRAVQKPREPGRTLAGVLLTELGGRAGPPPREAGPAH
jgi:thioredoxin-like negative regulator of GroEL